MDTSNKFLVGVQGDKVRIMRPPVGPITIEDALMLAAHLVAVTSPEKFQEFLEAVQNA